MKYSMRLRTAFVVAFMWLASASIAAAQTVIAIETAHDADSSAIVAHSFSAQQSVRTLGRVAHHADVVPMATLAPDGRALALLNVSNSGEPRRHTDLLLFDIATAQSRVLLTGLQQVPAAFSADNREVFVVRSEAMPPPSDEETRHGRLEDERLTVLAVDARSGRVREVNSDIAYMLHPIGVAHSSELIAIRASWGGGSIVAIDTRSGRTRTLVRSSMDAFRDASLSTDGLSVVALRRDARSNDVVRVRIEDSVVETIATNVSSDAAPIAVGASSSLLTSAHTDVRMIGPGSVFTLWSNGNARWLHAIAATNDARLIVLESIGSASRETLVLQTQTGACAPLSVPSNVVVHVAGIAGALP
jgi:hypothetical protein